MRAAATLFVLAVAGLALSGCVAYDVASTTVDAATDVAGAAVDVATLPVDAATASSDDDRK